MLPVGWVGHPYPEYDFNARLLITGDPELDLSLVAWSIRSGELPAGLSLSADGRISGTPSEPAKAFVQIRARYKTKEALAAFPIEIKGEQSIVTEAGARQWEDGTFAQSCAQYLLPTYPYRYIGDTGDGYYRIAPNDQTP